jgi:hypothetical protein
LGDCRKIHRALARDLRTAGCDDGHLGREIAAKICLVGQPVALGFERDPIAALRICASARLVTEAWSPNQKTTRENLQRELERVRATVSKIEWVVAHIDDPRLTEFCHET